MFETFEVLLALICVLSTAFLTLERGKRIRLLHRHRAVHIYCGPVCVDCGKRLEPWHLWRKTLPWTYEFAMQARNAMTDHSDEPVYIPDYEECEALSAASDEIAVEVHDEAE